MEEVIAISNEHKWHQTEGGSELLYKEMIELLGHYGEGPDIDKVLNGTFIPSMTASLATKVFLPTYKIHEGVTHLSNENDRSKRFHINKNHGLSEENQHPHMASILDISRRI